MATLEQVQAKLKKLQAQADAMLAKKAQVAVDQIRALMLEHGLTAADIEAKAKAKREGKALNGSAPSGKVNVAHGEKAKPVPKYLDPKTGATWSGHGRAPAWIAGAKDRTKFLIAEGAETAIAASAGATGKAKAAVKKSSAVGAVTRKGQRKGPQPAMYRDPKSGATWSGRGRAPGWLGADRSKFLIDGAGAGVDVSAAVEARKSAKKSIAAKSPAKKAASVGKKTTAKKASTTATKKVGAKKAPKRKMTATTKTVATAGATQAPESAVA
ncbi:H-NS family nucleoid-associated regulatory protein [Paraburkholderia sp. GAS334]|uniref:H-NS family nucleoid-associated regulatory protein n=1 Tax=Paraburkholderia sp. GAS334 TaxID=3035131 RepID=UPI003D22211C